jgi:hypothetical protein
MSTISWRPLLAVCASLISFVSFADAPTTFQDTLGITHEAAANVPAPTFRNPPPGSRPAQLGHALERVAINASGVDHTPVPAGDPRVFGEQIGPGRSARAMAIVHIAMFDALIAERRLPQLHWSAAREWAGFDEGRRGVRRARHARRALPVAEGFFRQRAAGQRAAATRFTGRNLQRCPPRQTSCRCDSRPAQR